MAENSDEGLRERKKKATRSALIATAIRLFRQRGFDAVTIDEICALSGASTRTFFRYFAAKTQIVLHDADVYRVAFSAVLVAPEPGEAPRATALRAALAVAHEIAARGDDLRPRIALIPQSPLLIAAWTELDRFWSQSLEVHFQRHRQPDANLLAGAIVGGLNAAFDLFLSDPRQDPERLTRRVFELVSDRAVPRKKNIQRRKEKT